MYTYVFVVAAVVGVVFYGGVTYYVLVLVLRIGIVDAVAHSYK